ncbi:MAG: hypothetical protein ACT4QF_05145 [Sporichthyaceae bacterium]
MDRLMGLVLPGLTVEVVEALEKDGERALAAQIPVLGMHSYCSCKQSNCAMFYAVPPPDGAWGEGHTNVMVDVARGMVVLDVINGVIVAVEILDRPDVKRLLPKLP